MRARNTNSSIPPVMSTSPGSHPTSMPSTATPTHRTPTNKTQPGSTPTKSQPERSSTGQHQGISTTMPPRSGAQPVQPMAPQTTPTNSGPQPTVNQLGTAPGSLQTKNSGPSNVARPPQQKPMLPWVLLGLFLLLAVSLLIFVLVRK